MRLLFPCSMLILFLSFILNESLSMGEPLSSEKSIRESPNVIYIMSDDHTAEAISAYNHLAPHLKGYVSTPHIDRLAEEGARFENVFCNFSLCSPSRASIMTGQYSHRTGVRKLGGVILPECQWVSHAIQNAGYNTALIGKWHLGNTPEGFNHYEVVHEQGTYFNPVFLTENGQEKYQGYATDVYTDRALAWLEQQKKEEKPFFLMLHYKAPHYPFTYAPRYASLFKDVSIPEPANLYEDRSCSPLLKTPTPTIVSLYYPLHKNDMDPPMGKPEDNSYKAITKIGYQHILKKYLRCIRGIDDNVGRILKYLDDSGLAKKTVVIYTSDQGYWLGQHGLYDKRIILDESIRMPFLVRYPGVIPAGTVRKELVSNVDFAATFLDIVQSASAQKDMPNSQGRSFYPLMRGEKVTDWRTGLFYCYTSQPAHWGIRTERYTLACFPGTDEVELYDNLKDPSQNKNVAQDPAYSEAVRETKAALEKAMQEIKIHSDQLPGGSRQYANDSGEAAPL